MTVLGGIGFSAPWLLWGLIALPILWLILRAVPPAPIRRRFPGVALLLGLKDDESVSDRTPWWLLALRILAVAAVIIGLAGPIWLVEPILAGRTDLAGRRELAQKSWRTAAGYWASLLAAGISTLHAPRPMGP